jgi:hypothetical protein
MLFTLVYKGVLSPNASKGEKWCIRRAIEPQLRKLWETPPLDKNIAKYQDPTYQPGLCYVGRMLFGLEFVPLISTALSLRAELEIFLLSGSLPGGILNRCGDIDNRLKTLFDALSIPAQSQQLPSSPDTEPDARVFCLLEDDKLITRVNVSNDRLLALPEGSIEALVIIRVHTTVFEATTANFAFG